MRIICPNCGRMAQPPKCEACGIDMEVDISIDSDINKEMYYYYLHRIKVLKKQGLKKSLISLKGFITQDKRLTSKQKQDLYKEF